jgi:hypothetical protein
VIDDEWTNSMELNTTGLRNRRGERPSKRLSTSASHEERRNMLSSTLEDAQVKKNKEDTVWGKTDDGTGKSISPSWMEMLIVDWVHSVQSPYDARRINALQPNVPEKSL